MFPWASVGEEQGDVCFMKIRVRVINRDQTVLFHCHFILYAHGMLCLNGKWKKSKQQKPVKLFYTCFVVLPNSWMNVIDPWSLSGDFSSDENVSLNVPVELIFWKRKTPLDSFCVGS